MTIRDAFEQPGDPSDSA